MLATLLLPADGGLHVEAVVLDEVSLTLLLCTTAPTARCPGCGHLSARVHSRYTRTLRDVPCATRRVRWQLRVRRFFCPTPPRASATEYWTACGSIPGAWSAGSAPRKRSGWNQISTDRPLCPPIP